jgi:hypothetical protein
VEAAAGCIHTAAAAEWAGRSRRLHRRAAGRSLAGEGWGRSAVSGQRTEDIYIGDVRRAISLLRRGVAVVLLGRRAVVVVVLLAGVVGHGGGAGVRARSALSAQLSALDSRRGLGGADSGSIDGWMAAGGVCDGLAVVVVVFVYVYVYGVWWCSRKSSGSGVGNGRRRTGLGWGWP